MNAGCGVAIDTVFNVLPESLQDLPAYTDAAPVEDSVRLQIESRIFFIVEISTHVDLAPSKTAFVQNIESKLRRRDPLRPSEDTNFLSIRQLSKASTSTPIHISIYVRTSSATSALVLCAPALYLPALYPKDAHASR